MNADYRKLSCKKGCSKDKLIETFEDFFFEQDTMITNLQNEHISLLNYLKMELVPYLECLAVAGDEAARDVLIDLSDYV
jgi:arginine deiminase